MNRSICTVGLLVVGVWASPSKGDALIGVVISHNGLNEPPFPGTGEVQVHFELGGTTFGPHRAEYQEVATHWVEYAYTPAPEPAMRADAFITNLTGVPWTGFRIRLEGADFAGYSPNDITQARADDPVVDIGFNLTPPYPAFDRIALQHLGLPDNNFSLAGSSITRSNDQGGGFLDAELIINLDNPLESNRMFSIRYNIIPPAGDPGSTGFTAYLTPIPEPVTAALLALAGLVAANRRHWL